ncbi:hypothetical protein XELAEV_18046449mg [Xenopus laevis]|uniref:Uncharacterized protein n=1 Tax=Xenopus laevis TaxID=8355 RepID=A0A974BTM9_XENLA|nr:hypothetical protein XELAEV_18046449mg [Xenopus laevis]
MGLLGETEFLFLSALTFITYISQGRKKEPAHHRLGSPSPHPPQHAGSQQDLPGIHALGLGRAPIPGKKHLELRPCRNSAAPSSTQSSPISSGQHIRSASCAIRHPLPQSPMLGEQADTSLKGAACNSAPGAAIVLHACQAPPQVLTC